MSRLVDIPFSTDLHLRLLLSLDRGHNVQRAVRAAVRPDDRVLDAGTGTGLLSFIALGAGASEAVGVDRQHVALARELAERNGFGDRTTFVEADLMRAELPGVDIERKFDVLLAFIYTNHPLMDEARSRMVFTLRDKFCTDQPVVVPGALRYRVTGCERTDLDLHTEFTDLDQAGEILHSVYGLDFQPLLDITKRELATKLSRPIDPMSTSWRPATNMASVRFPRAEIRLLTAPTDFAFTDYSAPSFTGFPSEVTLQVANAGRLNGVLWTQELLFDGQPLWTTETFSPIAQSNHVAAGDKVVLATDDQWRATNILASCQIVPAVSSSAVS